MTSACCCLPLDMRLAQPECRHVCSVPCHTEIPLDFPNKHVHDVGQGDFSIKPNVSAVWTAGGALWLEADAGQGRLGSCMQPQRSTACSTHPPGANPRLLWFALS